MGAGLAHEKLAGTPHEVLAILGGLEAYEVIGGKIGCELACRRQDVEHRLRRERDMQEKTDLEIDTQIAQRPAEWDQMIIVDPQDVAGLEKRRQDLGKFLIGSAIALVVATRIGDEAGAVMEQRPQASI